LGQATYCVPISRLLLACLLLAVGLAQAPAANRAAPPKRVRPPQWTPKTLELFHPDARQKLVGPRPAWGAAPVVAADDPAAESAEPAASPGPAQKSDWSKVIAADVLENEIKGSLGPLEVALSSSADFKGGGFKEVRERFSLLAALFAVIAEYDGDVRWQKQAVAARDRFARAGFNAKVASDAVFQEARARLDDLETLLQGGNVAAAPAGDSDWTELADRPALMVRMERAENQTLRPAASSAAEFRRLRDKVRQEAQVLAALARLIRGEGYEYADDETYLKYAEALERQAHELAEAAEKDDYRNARKAAADAHKSCDECHADYRS
jgi:hypothetical protein